MNERQRLQAIAACDRILASAARLKVIKDDLDAGIAELRAMWPAPKLELSTFNSDEEAFGAGFKTPMGNGEYAR